MLISIYKPYNNGSRYVLRMAGFFPLKSLVWEEMFAKIGAMQAVFVRDARTVEAMRVGAYAVIADSTDIMYIHSVKITDTEVWAYGYEAKGLFQRKPAMNAGDNGGEVSLATAIQTKIVDFGQISVFDHANNSYSGLGSENLDGMEYNNLYQYIQSALNSEGAGCRTEYNDATGLIRFSAFIGSDMTATAIFAPALGNAKDIKYTVDAQKAVNRVYVVGKDGDSIVYEVVDGGSGDTDVWAKYLDVRSDFPRPDGMTLADYKAALRTRGKISIAESGVKHTVDIGHVDSSRYGTDYTMGDTVTVVLPSYASGDATARVAGIKRTAEGNISKLTVVLDRVTIS